MQIMKIPFIKCKLQFYSTLQFPYLFYLIMNEQNSKEQQSIQRKKHDPNKQQIQGNAPNTNSITNNQQSLLVIISAKNKNIKLKKYETKKSFKGVEDNPDYFRVDMQICHKLYQTYRKLKIGGSQQESYNFEHKELGNQTMNYHKIMQIFKDIQFKLQIKQKLTILRTIKKFCFNQNFINEEEFIKIYKVIIHAFGLKQQIFKQIISAKYSSLVQISQSLKKAAFSIRLNKKFSSKLKTQPIDNQIKITSPANNNDNTLKQTKTLQSIKNHLNLSLAKKLESINYSPINQISQESNSIKGQSKKRVITEGRYEKMPDEKGYLSKSIQKNRLKKVTWQELFKIKEISSYQNICIPHFVSQNLEQEDHNF